MSLKSGLLEILFRVYLIRLLLLLSLLMLLLLLLLLVVVVVVVVVVMVAVAAAAAVNEQYKYLEKLYWIEWALRSSSN